MLHSRTPPVYPELISVRCTWQPGSFDIVKVQAGEHRVSLKLYALHRMFGPQAINDLFLSGLFCTSVGEQTVRALLSEASPDGHAKADGSGIQASGADSAGR